MDAVLPINPKTKVTSRVHNDESRRPVAMAALGPVYMGAAPPHPDLSDGLTAEAGVRKRFVMEPPVPERPLLVKLSKFVEGWCKNNLAPLSADVDQSLDVWLEATAYPEWRKKELRTVWEDFDGDIFQYKYTKVKSFIKDEWYPTYKHARAINARTDTFKCWFGPLVKLIETEVYKNHHFIKHVPVADRPEYIMRHLYREGADYLQTDYSSFEALFRKEIMEHCEFVLFRYMCKALPNFRLIIRALEEVLGGVNFCEFKWFVVRCLARRMSGEMCTSLSNGFSNLMFMLFTCQEVGFRDVDGVVEGDDGLFVGHGKPPGPADFARLGLIIKLQVYRNLAHASFCGIVFEPGDNVNVRDPIEMVVGFGWGDAKYARSKQRKKDTILRCKALSYAHQYPGAPIIQSMAHSVLRATRHVAGFTARYVQRAKMDSWVRELLAAAIKDESNIKFARVPDRTRLLVEELYGVSVDHQIILEEYFDSIDICSAFSHPLIDLYLNPTWCHYWDNYVVHRQPDIEYPNVSWTRLPRWSPEFVTNQFVT